MLKLIHTGDLHLDSPLSSVSPELSEKLRSAGLRSFTELMKYAKAEEVDAVLIAGDLFDGAYATKATVDTVAAAIDDFGGPVFISPGNHDPYTPTGVYAPGRFPENAYIFTEETLTRIDLPKLGLSVLGYAFISDSLGHSPLSDRERALPHQGRVNVLCAHADITSPISKYAPITDSDLAASGCVYAALGHIHNPPEDRVIGKTYTAYSGFLYGRSYDEQGFGGARLVTLDGDRVTVERISFSKHRYLSLSLDITGATSDRDVVASAEALVKREGLGRETSLCLTLEGAVAPEYTPSGATVDGDSLGLCSLKLKDRTLPIYDAEYLGGEISLRGEVYRTLLPLLQNGSIEDRARAAEALRIALSALAGRNILE